jgi:hypothetical protein
LSVKRLNNEIEKLYGEKHALLAEFAENTNKNPVGQQATYEKPNNLRSNRSSVSSIHGGGSIVKIFKINAFN